MQDVGGHFRQLIGSDQGPKGFSAKLMAFVLQNVGDLLKEPFQAEVVA